MAGGAKSEGGKGWRKPDRAGSAFGSLLSAFERDLSEAETIAERRSMLIWQIEVALERTRLYLTWLSHEITDADALQTRVVAAQAAHAKLAADFSQLFVTDK